jgi:hypothetical protein
MPCPFSLFAGLAASFRYASDAARLLAERLYYCRLDHMPGPHPEEHSGCVEAPPAALARRLWMLDLEEPCHSD